MNNCGCVSLKHGVALLVGCGYTLTESYALTGMPALSLARAAHVGSAFAFFAALTWICAATLGIYWSIAGYRAMQSHYELVNSISLVRSVGVIGLCYYL